ncbi:uncharacterized protein LOC119404927 isoform X2 [Rhipicephalus sanguineus]|uniref:uncharacterized protein LOC119404927 isoform X2 n=1 Tax=Rhipicephalus sanguineus TaxID=34632 RepID=UPI0020C3F9E2|nr:uncharacterized protein LOC119404927 isoform X2 [Rhipicephalus sanguineus]
MESLERKVVLLQRFNKTAKDHKKALEALRDTIGERVDALRQFDQLLSADQLYRTEDLPQDDSSNSAKSPRVEQGAICGDGSLPAMESLEDILKFGRSLGACPKSKPNLAAGGTDQTTLLSDSAVLDTTGDLDETLKPNLVVGDTDRTTSLSDSTEEDTFNELDKTMIPNLAVGDTKQTASVHSSSEPEDILKALETMKRSSAIGKRKQATLRSDSSGASTSAAMLASASERRRQSRFSTEGSQKARGEVSQDDILTILKNTGDLFCRESEELWTCLQDFKKGNTAESPETPLKQSIKYWMKLVETLQSSCSTQGNVKTRQGRRLSSEWTPEDSSFKEEMLSLRDRGRDQIKRQMQSLRRQKRMEEELQQDIDILDKLAKELEDRNMDVIYKMREKHVHGKTTAAKEHQRLLLKVKDLHTSLQAWNVKARDSLFSSNVRIADERPPAYTGGSAKCRDVIIQEALNSLDNIQTQKGDVGMSEVANKLEMAEGAVSTAKCFVESDPASEGLEVRRSVEALLEQDQLFVELQTKIEGRTFEEWVPEAIELLAERLHHEGASQN